MDRNALWEAIKEPLRLLVLAIIPFGLAYFGAINEQWAIGITVALRFVDKFLHEVGKISATRPDEESFFVKGLTRF